MMNVNRPRVVRPSAARHTDSRATHLATAAGAVAGVVWLAHVLEFDRPTAFDKHVRRLARSARMDIARFALAPLFPIGLPGTYITIAYAASYWLKRKRKRGGRAIVSAAWLGWLVHRAVKLGYRRERPLRPGVRRRTDSYPSGHTTGATSLALAMTYVLRRGGVISTRRAATIAGAAAGLMGVYRVVADDHWVTDVIGGWMLGGAIALVCASTLTETESTSPRPRRRDHRESLASRA
jgi:membrane-associated phospholipid phosphatase